MTQASVIAGYNFEGAAPESAGASFTLAGISVDVVEDLGWAERDWRAFEQHADGTVFQSFEWLSTWQRHIGAREGAQPVIVIGRGADGKLLFLLPLAVQPAGLMRELAWLGMELCDYTGPLLAPDFAKRVSPETFASIWQQVLQMLSERVGFDLVRLEKMPERIGAQPNPMLGLAATRNPSGAYLTELSGNWDEFYAAKRSASTRRRERTKRKNLAALGELRFVEPASEQDRLTTIDRLMLQKAAALARIGVSNFFERPGYAEFYRAISGEAIAHVSRLDIGDIAGASNLGLIMRGRYYHLLASYTDDAAIMRHGPGAAHLMEIMRHAIERGCSVFDFTIGDEPYKRDWCEERQTLYDHLSARTLRGSAAVLSRSLALRAKRAIKENPALWDAFFKLRSVAGAAKSRVSQRA
jgi:CelD/BcsL family acetyltransferase involved in cellulose biosynthesis